MVTVAASAGCNTHAGPLERRVANIALDLEFQRMHAPMIERPLTLADALQYAQQYNIQAWISAQESKLQHEQITQSALKMLPAMLIGGEYSERSHYDASSSQSLRTGKQSLEPSFSSEVRVRTFDVTATWNLLDFGISFLRTRQQGNRAMIAAENERRVRQNLAFEVTRTYWAAVAARESAECAERIGGQVCTALESIRKEIEEKTVSQVDGLRQETLLLQRFEELRGYRRSFRRAQEDLAALIGLPPGAPFELARVDCDQPVPPLSLDADALEWQTLRNRPELFQKDLEELVVHDEALVAIAEMLPSPAGFWRYDSDRNRFLVYNQWNTVGIRASWDLLALPAQIQGYANTRLQAELVARERTAIAVAMLTQLHLAIIDFHEAAEQREFSRNLSRKHDALLEAIQSEADEGKASGGDALDQELSRLRARARYLADHADLMTSIARLSNTIGTDLPVPARGEAHALPPEESGVRGSDGLATQAAD